MGSQNVCVMIGVRKDGTKDALHIGLPSELSALLPTARRAHEEYRELLIFDRVTRREFTRSDLPALPESVDE